LKCKANHAFEPNVAAFLNFCRIEKGLAPNTLEAYRRDLESFSRYCTAESWTASELDSTRLRQFLDSRYKAHLSSRSIARLLASLRNFYLFLIREGRAKADPTADVGAPRQWKRLPRFLGSAEIQKLLQTPDCCRPLGVREIGRAHV